MRILYVLDYFYPHVGGVPTLFMNIAREMVRRGHDVTVITTRPSGTKSFEIHNGIKIIRIGKSRNDFLFRASLHLLSWKIPFDIIHTSTYSAMIPAFVTSLFRKIPAVVTVHEVWSFREMLEFYRTKGAPYFLEQKILLSMPFRKYFSPSIHTKKDLQSAGIHYKKIIFIPHGIDKTVFNPSMKKFRTSMRRKIGVKNSDVLGIFIGKPTVFKGLYYLLEAIKIASKKMHAKFIFVLSPLYKEEQEKLISNISKNRILRDRIILLEHNTNHEYIAKLIGASDFVVMPSLTEGFGFVAAEAASVGIPSIVTTGTSLPEVVEKNRHAIYVKPRNPVELADAIVKLSTNSKLRKRLSKSKIFKDWKQVVDEYEKAYQSIANYKEV